jgi:hypothetical protein
MSTANRQAGDMFRASLTRTQANVRTLDIDLTSGLSNVIVNSPGTLVYFDRVTTGYASVSLRQEGGALDPLTFVSGDSLECPFASLLLNAPAQPGKTLRLVIGNGISIRGGTGLSTGTSIASIVSSRSANANTQKTVTSTSAQLMAAAAARNYLLIQNKDASGSIYLNFGAGAATVANGVLVGPGGNYEPSVIPTDAIQAIGSIASNANIVVVEGF